MPPVPAAVPAAPLPPVPPAGAPPPVPATVPPVPDAPPAGASASTRLFQQKSNGTAAVIPPGTRIIAAEIGSFLYAMPAPPAQHSVFKLDHAMKPPEPVIGAHQRFCDAPSPTVTWKRSADMTLIFKSIITPAFVGVTVPSAIEALSWLRFKPSMAEPL